MLSKGYINGRSRQCNIRSNTTGITFILLLVVISVSLHGTDAFAPAAARNANTQPSQFSSTSHTEFAKLNAFAFPDLAGLDFDILRYTADSTAGIVANGAINSSTSISSLAVLYFAGLLTSFSPCSMGLLPLTISYISTAAGERDDNAVFLPTVAFALGLASVFCGFGLSVSLVGGVFGSSGGENALGALLLGLFSGGISIAMGLQLLELVEIPIPSFEVGNFAQDDDDKTEESGGISALFRTFLLGGSSALVASPCATPVLTSILGFVAASRDPLLGSILLFTYTMGYSTPLLIIGASGGQAMANAQMASLANEDSFLAKIGNFVSPTTASVLIIYGTNGILTSFLGDPSLAGLAPVLE